jgi:hypothetical protein
MAYTGLDLNPGSGGATVSMKETTTGKYATAHLVGEAGSDNTAPVSATNGLAVDPKTLPPGAATAAKQDTGNTSLASIDTNVATRLSESDFDTKVGSLTEGAPATDTASSGLNGRLQRIAQRITSLITALGTPLQAGGDVNVTDRAARDMGKIDIAAFDVALPTGSNRVGKVTIRNAADGADIDPVAEGTWTGRIGEVTASPTANTVLDRLKTIATNLGAVVIAAGTALIGRVSASLETSTIYNGTTSLTPKWAVIDVASSGDNTIVAAVTSKKIRILSVFLVAAGTVTVRFESGAGGTALSGQMNLIANTGFVLPFSPVGWGETAVTTLLNLELSGAVSVDGIICYVEV